MFVIYDLIFLIFSIIYLPYFLLRKKLHQGFIQRLGFLPSNLQLDRPIWVHAVSVGEARLAGILVRQLRQIFPEKKFVFSTVTPTGNRIVRSFQQEGDFVFYLPLDLSFITKRVIKRLRPCVCIIIETEIWPNLITYLNRMHAPIILVNARISDSSFLGYRIAKPLIKPILNKVNLFCVRSNQDAKRLSALGLSSDRFNITGNMKYDIIDYLNRKVDYTGYRLKLGLKKEDRLFVAGSTHPGEEEIILSVYKKLINEFSELRLFIAPRHPERAKQIERVAARFGFQTIFISTLDSKSQTVETRGQARGTTCYGAGFRGAEPRTVPHSGTGAWVNHKSIFVLDIIGELLSFYAIADIVFVGGSLIKKGGQNILEPAYFSKAILFGPYMFNFRDISDLFLTKEAAHMVRGQGELLEEIKFLLNNTSKLRAMGSRARQLILENHGATQRNVQKISIFISHG